MLSRTKPQTLERIKEEHQWEDREEKRRLHHRAFHPKGNDVSG